MKKIIIALMLLAPMTMFAQKFGCVDYDAVATNLPEYAKAQGELQALAKQYENELKAMNDEFQSLTELNTRIQEAYQTNQQELQKKQQELLNPIQGKVAQAIENVGKNGQYVYIMIKGSLPYISTTLCDDVTEACKTEVLKIK